MIREKIAHLSWLFKDDSGQVVIWQWPNIPLYGWIASKALAILFDNPQLKIGFEYISTAFLFSWALLELLQGVNYFRRLLGLVVLVVVFAGFISHN